MLSSDVKMGAKAAGSVFWAYLVLFPVAVQLSSAGCVTYKHIEICALKGSSVEFICSYPNDVQDTSIIGWCKSRYPCLKPKAPADRFQMNYRGNRDGNKDCTVKLMHLTEDDASIYYFTYNYKHVTGVHKTCSGIPGVRLHIVASPVHILVKKIVSGQEIPVPDWTVMEGQRIMLTCVLNCAANLNSNPGYIWSKDGLQLDISKVNSPFLSLHSVSMEDMGSYVCAMIDYEDHPSPIVSLRVQNRPSNNVGGSIGQPNKDSLPTPKTPTSKRLFPLSIMLVVSVCIGLVIAITVAIVAFNVKKKNKKRRCAGSVPGTPHSNSDNYMAMDINSMSPEYETLETMRPCTMYENLHQPGNSMR